MTTTTGAIRRLELMLASMPDTECADDLRVVLADAVLSRAELEAAKQWGVDLSNELTHRTTKLTEARRLLDDARAQKPTAWRPKFDIEGDWSLGEPSIESIEYWHEQGLEIEYAYLRAAPVPAQPAADENVAEDAYHRCCELIEPHVIREGRAGGTLPASLVGAVEMLIERHAKQPAAVPEAVAKDAAPSCFTCIHGAKDDEDYPCRSCRMMSHWSSAAARPQPAAVPLLVNEISDICNAYESGVGHRGRPTANVNPYPKDTAEFYAYAMGAAGKGDAT